MTIESVSDKASRRISVNLFKVSIDMYLEFLLNLTNKLNLIAAHFCLFFLNTFSIFSFFYKKIFKIVYFAIFHH